MHDFFDFLNSLDLPGGDFAVFGSGPLIIRNIIAPTNDLDVICRGVAWQKIRKLGSLQINDDYDVEIITLLGGQVTFGNRWGIGDFDVDQLIDDAEIIDGLPFVRLEHVIKYKSIRKSEKDLAHIEAFRRSKYGPAADDGHEITSQSAGKY